MLKIIITSVLTIMLFSSLAHAQYYLDSKEKKWGFAKSTFEKSMESVSEIPSTLGDQPWQSLLLVGFASTAYLFDKTLYNQFQNSDPWPYLANLGSPYIILPTLAFLYHFKLNFNEDPVFESAIERSLQSALSITLVNVMLRTAIHRTSPKHSNGDESDFSLLTYGVDFFNSNFPSLETSLIFSTAYIFSETYNSLSITLLSYTLAAAVSFAQIQNNKAWTSDVVIGAILGIYIADFFLEDTIFTQRDNAVYLSLGSLQSPLGITGTIQF